MSYTAIHIAYYIHNNTHNIIHIVINTHHIIYGTLFRYTNTRDMVKKASKCLVASWHPPFANHQQDTHEPSLQLGLFRPPILDNPQC